MKFNIRSLNLQSTTLKLLALGLAALLGVLILGGIQAIARVQPSAPDLAQRPAPSATLSFPPLPAAPSLPTFSAPAASPDDKLEPAVSTQPAPKESRDQVRPERNPSNRPPTPARPAPQPRPEQSRPAPASPAPSPAAAPTRTPVAVPTPDRRPAAPVASPSPAPLTPLTPTYSAPNPNLTTNMPAQASAPADPTNFGDRYATDIYGRPVSNALLVVLHETVGSASSAVNTMQTPHPNEDDQVSYHSIIKQDGTVIYVVAPEKRAFGAGNSVFNGASGPEAVKTHKDFPPSVNNFAYHISLESPSDGRGGGTTHSGYSDDQYKSLAWLIAWTNVDYDRITTHRAVDQSGSRIDPRSFNTQSLIAQLQNYPRAAAQQ